MKREQKVVLHEYKLKLSGYPFRRMHMQLGKLLYSKHPFGRSGIGTPGSIRLFTPSSALEIHRRYYRPWNATLVIAGDLPASQVAALVAERFPKRQIERLPLRRKWAEIQILTKPKQITFNKTDGQSRSNNAIIRKLVTIKSRNLRHLYQTAKLLQTLLSSALPGGLAGTLRYENRIARSYDLKLSIHSNKTIEMWAWLEAEQGITSHKALQEFFSALTKSVNTTIPEASINRVVSRSIRSTKRKYTSVNRAMDYAIMQLSRGVQPQSLKQELKGILDVSKSDIDDLLRSIHKPGRIVIGHLTPPVK